MDLATRLGDRAARSRRHRRVALLGIALLVIAAVLLAVGQDDDDGPSGDIVATCEEFGDRVQREYALSFPDGAPLDDDAAAEYLSHAFADTMDDLVAALRAQSPGGEVAGLVDDLAARVDEVRANPLDFVQASPLGELAERFDDADLAACGSEFLEPSE